MSEERTIKTATHGRYLVQPPSPTPSSSQVAPVLVGFHGYGEGADTHLNRLVSIPGADQWLVVSIQGLHRFYDRKAETVVASWMTRQDRELMIADNVAYVTSVLAAVTAEWPVNSRLVFAGFSQGVAMAYRAACLGPHEPLAVVALGADVPPDLSSDTLRRVPAAILGRGAHDKFYADAKWREDEVRLRAAGVDVTPCQVDAGHEWTDQFSRAVGGFLARLH